MNTLHSLCFLIFLIHFPFLIYAQTDYEVEEYYWTDSVLADNEFKYLHQLGDSTEIDIPIIWIKLKCYNNFLSELDSLKYIPFKFKWRHKGLVPIGQIKDAHSELGNFEKFTELKNEYQEALDDKGYFELIIWSSYERKLRKGLWNIKFLYNDNSPIKCSNDDCLFDIVKK